MNCHPEPSEGPAFRRQMPVSGTLPKQENTVAKNVSSTSELPPNVVEVHRNPETWA
jgi:hypothetical protein